MSTPAPAPIIGLEKAITCPRTEAPLAFHKLFFCQINFVQESTVATLGAFSSRTAKQHVSTVQVAIKAVPEGDNAQWIYEQILATHGDENVLAGATAVRAEAPAAPEGD